MRFLHISDIHVTTDYSKVPLRKLGWRRFIAMLELTVGGRGKAYENSPGTLQQIVRDFERHKADHLLVTGDFTAYAMEAEFQGARTALAPLIEDPQRATAIPGNHDTYTPDSRRDRLFEKYFGHLIQSDLPEYAAEEGFPFVKLLGTETALVGLMSARVPPVPGLSYGFIGKAQLDAVARLLLDKRLDGRAVLVMVHHAPLKRDGGPDTRTHGLVDANKLFALLQGPRFAVLHGHIHQRYHHAADATRPHVFGAGSSTQKGHEGYWIIETGDGVVKGAWSYEPGGSTQTFTMGAHKPATV